MRSRTVLILISFFVINLPDVFAQKQFIQEADKLFEQHVYSEAAKMYTVLLQETYDHDQALKLAQCYMAMNMPLEAEYWYAQLAGQKITDPKILFNYARLLKSNGKYSSAKQVFLQYAQYDADGFYFAGTCDYAITNNTVNSLYEIDTLPVNTEASEIAPAFFGKGIIFASDRHMSQEEDQKLPFYDLYYAAIDKDSSAVAGKLSDNINSKLHEASATYDNIRNELYFTRNNYVDDRIVKSKANDVKLKILIAKYNSGKWNAEGDFEFNNKNYSVGQPALSSDGSVLLFISDMPGGFGGTDIYFSKRSDNGWTTPQNMGEAVNTKGDEMFPFLSDDGTLYFSSDWLPGYGGFDIFYTNREDEHWAKPKNIGQPVNSPRDDMGFIMENGSGFFSSNRTGGKGNDDIYSVTVLNGINGLYITDDEGIPLFGASVKLLEGNHLINAGQTDENGFIYITLEPQKNYAVQISKTGFAELSVPDAEKIKSSTGILPVTLISLMGEHEEVPPAEDKLPPMQTTDEVKTDTTSAATPAKDFIVYDVQIGVFKNPDYAKIFALNTYGELSSKSQADGSLSFSLINFTTLEDAEKAKQAAIKSGFSDAFIITYKNGAKQ